MNAGTSQYWVTRLIIQRLLAFTYFVGFAVVINQFIPLVGVNGLNPAPLFTSRIDFWQRPSLFWFESSDFLFLAFGWAGLALSLLALSGVSERFGMGVSAAVWGMLWLIYLSFVNVGQVFYGFGWESILLEVGFLAIFFGSRDVPPPKLVIWLLRWVLFRIMFGAGLIKVRADPCWRDLTCMVYHYETQPVPNPLSWYFHALPVWFHKLEVAFTHFVELIVPLGYFWPRRLRIACGALTIAFQFILILSGNLAWLNYVTIFIALSCFDDDVFKGSGLPLQPDPNPPCQVAREDLTRSLHRWAVIALTVAVGVMSIAPTVNMLSPKQRMNASFNSLHLVNTYGAFGSVTRVRHEVILEGTDAANPTPLTQWKEYEFKCKPGDISKAPCLMSPYLYKIDWQIWFAAMSDFRNHPWLLNLISKFLKNDEKVLGLIAKNPFPDKPPKFVRATLFKYEFTTAEERKETGNWWKRERVGQYLPPLSLENAEFKRLLESQGWL